MMALGSTALHLRIAEFKFTHNFKICDQLPEKEPIFGIDIQKKFSLSCPWDKDKNCYIQQNGKVLVYTHTNTCMVTIGKSNQLSRYQPDTMVWSQSRSVDHLSQHIWHTSLQMTVLPKERTPTLA